MQMECWTGKIDDGEVMVGAGSHEQLEALPVCLSLSFCLSGVVVVGNVEKSCT